MDSSVFELQFKRTETHNYTNVTRLYSSYLVTTFENNRKTERTIERPDLKIDTQDPSHYSRLITLFMYLCGIDTRL
jgi:hypothetical protein